jgi:hypothetical protein
MYNPKEWLSLIVEPGPFPTLGHSSYTNQKCALERMYNPKECLSYINLQNGPFFMKLLITVNFERMTARRGGPFYLTTTQSDYQEE